MTQQNSPSGKNPATVLEILSGCRSFADVKAAGILFHGTCEEISGDLRGGPYDGVFWTAEAPNVAQAYIPRSGISCWLHAPAEWERDDRLKPTKGDGFVMRWALERSGATREDLQVEWNGLSPWSWAIPKGWPTEGDFDDYIRSMGYIPDETGTYTVSTSYGAEGETLMPADWSLPGHLLVILPQGVTIRDPEWSEDALGYENHNRVADFASFARRGVGAFHMSDQLQSNHWGNVDHKAIGILPAALDRLCWLAIPAIRHDGEDHSVWENPETPEFIAFMKGINPDYRSVSELAEICTEEPAF